jgi:radical SAM superfamily enzyme YgiQ (UPF0313 family)
VRRFGARNIYFIDLEFTASPEIAEGISEYILGRNLSVRWCCQTRTDQVTEPMLRLMKRAGCRLIHYGIETASQRIAELTRKMVSVQEQREGVRLTQRVGIETLCFFLLGHPGETEEEMRETIRLAHELNPTYASFHRVAPYPGSALYEEISAATGELFPAFAGTEAERREVDRLVRQAIWSYYMRPGFILSRLAHSSPASWWRQLRLFAGYFR